MSKLLREDIGDDDDYHKEFDEDDDQIVGDNNNDNDDDRDGQQLHQQLVENLIDAANVKKGAALRGAAKESHANSQRSTKSTTPTPAAAPRERVDACSKQQETEIATLRAALQERLTGFVKSKRISLLLSQCVFVCWSTQWAVLLLLLLRRRTRLLRNQQAT